MNVTLHITVVIADVLEETRTKLNEFEDFGLGNTTSWRLAPVYLLCH
jgi:hypothetical protein